MDAAELHTDVLLSRLPPCPTLGAMSETAVLQAQARERAERKKRGRGQRGTPRTSSVLSAYWFHSRDLPKMSVQTYVWHLARCDDGDPAMLVLYALELLDRALRRTPSLHLCHHSAHRFLLVAILLAHKMLCDDVYTNEWWAMRGGVTLAELNTLEAIFLGYLDYSLWVESLDSMRAWLECTASSLSLLKG